MPGPLPKSDDERRRRNAPTIPTTDLPLDGYAGPVPEPIVELGVVARKYYERAWSSPAAAAWHASEADAVAEWAGLKAHVAEELRTGVAPSASILAQIKGAEDRLYLSPLARQKARTRIVAAELDEDVDGRPAAGGRLGDIEAV